MIKVFHMTLAFLSVAGFVIRLGWSYNAADLLAEKWVRIAPHIIDSLLLALGVYLALNLVDGPLTMASHGWLAAKLIGLVGYILFGVLALRGLGTAKHIGAFGALFCIGYIFWVAFTRQILP